MRQSLLALAVGAILAAGAFAPAPAAADNGYRNDRPQRVVVIRDKKPKKVVIVKRSNRHHHAHVVRKPARQVVIVRERRPREVLVVR
jgi:hypothetical protein